VGNLLSKGQAMLARLMSRAAAPATEAGSAALTYQPVANPTDETDLTGKAWVGRTVFSRLNREGGAAVVFGDRDYLIPVAELPNEPQRGDRITEVISGVEAVFEVVEPMGEPAWRYSDPGHTVYRVHTKKQVA
jgi:hypothetical protein